MSALQLAALGIMAAFYTAYVSKILLQRKRGIQTDQIGKGSKPTRVLATERLMKLAAYAIIPVEIVSILFASGFQNGALRWFGLFAAALGVFVFVFSMTAMRDSWRAGIPEKGETELITTGIYAFSRNPAFLGFDLMYIGLLAAFFNLVHLMFVIFAAVMLHLQILQEEAFLADAFGKEYQAYKARTGRYLFIL